MASKFKKGQKVIIKAADNKESSLRDSALEAYAGRVGRIADYYWIKMEMGRGMFYLYTVKMDGTDAEEVVVHEDEMEAHFE